MLPGSNEVYGTKKQPHIVVVDAYEGFLEYLGAGPQDAAACGLGLPLGELADALDARVTVLDWHDWLQFERRGDSFQRWVPFPATTPVEFPDIRPNFEWESHPRIVKQSIPADDPDWKQNFAEGLSPLTHGLLANSDPLFLASYVLNACLERLNEQNPIALVILPMWGGCGYVPQMSRVTGAGLCNVRFTVVVTDTSARRQSANGEGLWHRAAITRRQMEDMSLGLADLALCYGPRGEQIARHVRGDRAVVRAPRHVDSSCLDAIAKARADDRSAAHAPSIFICGPLQPSSGALVMLDAAQELRNRGCRPASPISCSGPNMMFAPLKPRDFASYWNSRGWVRELIAQGFWEWRDVPPDDAASTAVRYYASLFDHLPNIWVQLASGGLVALSPAAAEGFAPGETLPPETLLSGEPTPALVSDHIEHVLSVGSQRLEQARQQLCQLVVRAHRGSERKALLEGTAGALRHLLSGDGYSPPLTSVARMLLDRRPSPAATSVSSAPAAPAESATLTVAVVCYEMGALLSETVRSVWNSDRLPDELILVDDGSHGTETLAAITELESEAHRRKLPWRLLRQPNRGLAAARNAALAAATCNYISFIDGDDLIEPAFYGLALKVLNDNPGLGGVSAWAVMFGEGVPPGFWNAPQPELPLLLVENTVIVPCMMPVALLRDVGGYDVSQRYNYEDWELAIRMLANGWPIVTIPRYLQRYRVRQDSLFRTMSDVQNQVMRELLFDHHRETAEKFAPEIAMQIEHQLMKARAEQVAAQRNSLAERIKPVAQNVRAARRTLHGLTRLWSRSGK